MPIYEFRCAKCSNLCEVVQRVGSRPPPCPVCGSKQMTRAVSRTAFHLKGGGWYADLYSTPRPGGDKADGAEAGTPAVDKPKEAAPAGDKPAGGAQPEVAAKPAAPASETTAVKPQRAPGEGPRPTRRRPAPPRKRR